MFLGKQKTEPNHTSSWLVCADKTHPFSHGHVRQSEVNSPTEISSSFFFFFFWKSFTARWHWTQKVNLESVARPHQCSTAMCECHKESCFRFQSRKTCNHWNQRCPLLDFFSFFFFFEIFAFGNFIPWTTDKKENAAGWWFILFFSLILVNVI